MGRFSCYIKSRGLNFYCPLRRCSCTDSTLGHYATRNNDPCQPVLPRETYLPSIGRFIPSELSGVQLDEVVHARGRLARELEQIVVAELSQVQNLVIRGAPGDNSRRGKRGEAGQWACNRSG